MKLNSCISLPTDADDENFFKKGKQMNSILCNTHATTIFIAYHISNSRKKPLRGADFLTSKQIQFFPSSFLKKAAADLKKAQEKLYSMVQLWIHQ